MKIEEIKKHLEKKLNRIEKCETQFLIGQKQQIADILLMLNESSQNSIINLSHKSFEINNITEEQQKELETQLNCYMLEKHTYDECKGFVDGFKKAISMFWVVSSNGKCK